MVGLKDKRLIVCLTRTLCVQFSFAVAGCYLVPAVSNLPFFRCPAGPAVSVHPSDTLPAALPWDPRATATARAWDHDHRLL